MRSQHPARWLEHCNPRQLQELLVLAGAGTSSWFLEGVARADFDARLARTQIPGHGSAEILVAELLDSNASLATFRAAKRSTKKMLGETSENRDVLVFVYHVAVAAACVFHAADITSRPRASRRDLYAALAELLAAKPAGRIFARAAELAAGDEVPGIFDTPPDALPDMAPPGREQ